MHKVFNNYKIDRIESKNTITEMKNALEGINGRTKWGRRMNALKTDWNRRKRNEKN